MGRRTCTYRPGPGTKITLNPSGIEHPSGGTPARRREIEIRAAEAEEARREAERQAPERQRNWERAMEKAKERYLVAIHRASRVGGRGR